MTGYLDELRHLVVDMKKNKTTIKQLKMYDKIHQKLAELGVGMEQADDWLDICQQIATESISAKQFVAAALHLAQLEADTGHDPESLVAEFESKSEALKTLKAEIVETTGKKEKATMELDSINEAKAAAQEQYDSQTAELKSKMDNFMAQNQLSWNMVNTVMAILEGEFAKQELGEGEIEKITKQIAKTGSLAACIHMLEEKVVRLDMERQDLAEEHEILALSNAGSLNLFHQMSPYLMNKVKEDRELEAMLHMKKSEIARLEIMKTAHANDIYTGWLILSCLISPELIDDYNLDRLVELMVGIRQVRLGRGPKKILDAKGNVLCECRVPQPYTPLKEYGVAMKEARDRLARYLVPFVEDKFMPRFEYETAKMTQVITEMYKQLSNALSGHPGAPYQSANPPGLSEQKSSKTTAGNTGTDENLHNTVPTHSDIPEHSGSLQGSLWYGSAETAKKKMDVDKSFLTSIS